MRMIFEEDIEGSDFLEIAVSRREYEKGFESGICADYPGGLQGKRNLNVFVRVTEEFEEMPFKSQAQRKYLFAKEPAVAKEFAEHTSKQQMAKLPEHVKKKPRAAKKGK